MRGAKRTLEHIQVYRLIFHQGRSIGEAEVNQDLKYSKQLVRGRKHEVCTKATSSVGSPGSDLF
jgi:hypothetical protein